MNSLESTLKGLVSLKDFPEWLISKIELFEYGGELGMPQSAQFYRETRNG